jgi:hypothetical protein
MKGIAARARNRYATTVKIVLPLEARRNRSGGKS